MIPSLSAAELAAWLADPQRAAPILLDVREAWEVQICALPGITHLPMHLIPTQWQSLDPEAEIVCICHHGARSMQAAAWLAQQGFEQVLNLSGGMAAWARQVDPAMPTY